MVLTPKNGLYRIHPLTPKDADHLRGIQLSMCQHWRDGSEQIPDSKSTTREQSKNAAGSVSANLTCDRILASWTPTGFFCERWRSTEGFNNSAGSSQPNFVGCLPAISITALGIDSSTRQLLQRGQKPAYHFPYDFVGCTSVLQVLCLQFSSKWTQLLALNLFFQLDLEYMGNPWEPQH